MQTITVSHYTDEQGAKMHTVIVGGVPVMRETQDESAAWAKARQVASGAGQFRGRGARYELKEWDGDTGELRDVESGRVAA